MYALRVKGHFSAAHRLRGYHGACEALHGHTWTVEVDVGAPAVDDIGLALDFRIIKQALHTVLERLDHADLNAVPPFTERNPSAENLAHYIFGQLQPALAVHPVTLKAVHVWESPDTRATYTPD